jgi:hypothetical protein
MTPLTINVDWIASTPLSDRNPLSDQDDDLASDATIVAERSRSDREVDWVDERSRSVYLYCEERLQTLIGDNKAKML